MINKYLLILCVVVFSACRFTSEKHLQSDIEVLNSSIEVPDSVVINIAALKSKNPLDFIPNDYVLYTEDGVSEIKGDLNQDSLEDVVLLIKGTDQASLIIDEYRGELDRNRRGIIVLFNKGDYYELATVNYDCFSSEQEDGGNYFPPELLLTIGNGNLYIMYLHGRYGNWKYTFRHQNGDFELIGYDSHQNRGPVPQSRKSINFLSKKMLYRDNLNKDIDGDEYVKDNFVEKWHNITVDSLLKLSEIKDFDNLDFE